MQYNKAEIITIGTELLLGQILNINAQWLSEHMAQQGINVYHQTVVGDNHERLQSSFQMAQARSDIIIVSGGLGPTDDDMTREAFQSLTSLEMVEDPVTIKKIEDFFAKRDKIGRASCRERVESSDVAGGEKKKKEKEGAQRR